MKNKDTYNKGVAKDQEKHTGEQGEFFTFDGTDNIGVTDMFIDDGFDIIHQHRGNVHLSDLSPEESETAIPQGTKKVKKVVNKPNLSKAPFNVGLNEHNQPGLNPTLEVDDIIRVLGVDGEHARMPEKWGLYKVVNVGSSYDEYYDITPYPNVESRVTRYYKELGAHHKDSDYTLYRGDIWIYADVDRNTINENKQPGLNPELTYGDTILVVDVDREVESNTTKYNIPSPNMKPEIWAPYTVVDKESNGSQSRWPWRYTLVPEDKLEEYEESLVLDGHINYLGYEKLLYPWIYQWIYANTPTANKVDRLTISEHNKSLRQTKNLNPDLMIGDEIMVVSTEGIHDFGSPVLYKPYVVVGIKHAQRQNWQGPETDTRYYQIEPIGMTDDERTGAMLAGGGRMRPLYIFPPEGPHGGSDHWILNPEFRRGELEEEGETNEAARTLSKARKAGVDTYYPKSAVKANPERFRKYTRDKYLNEYNQPGLNPVLKVDDIVRVIDVDGEHGRMPERFKTYRVVRVGNAYPLMTMRNRGHDTYYDMVDYPSSSTQFSELDVKSLYRGDTWIYADVPMTNKVDRKTINEDKESINNMVYIEKPRKKHLQKMGNTLGNFKEFNWEKFKNTPPPKNDSKATENEIKEVQKIKVNKKFVDTTDDIHEHFEDFLKTKDIEYPKKEVNKSMKGLSRIIIELKYHYNRPRPGQIAEKKKIKLKPTTLDTASTPAYPSGHALRGRFIGRYLSEKYPDYHDELLKLGDEIGEGRLMAKVHYPSDNKFGKKIGDELYNHYYSTKGLELKEITLKEEMEELSPPLEVGDKIVAWDLVADPTPPGSTNVEWKMPTTLLGTIVDVYDDEEIKEVGSPQVTLYRGGIKYIVRDDNSGEEYGLYQGTELHSKYPQSKMVRNLSGRDKWKIIGKYEEIINEQEDGATEDPEESTGIEYGTFNRKDIIILNYLTKRYTKDGLKEVWETASLWGNRKDKWLDIMKLFGIVIDANDPEQWVRSSRYARWAWDNWDEAEEYNFDYSKLPNPIKSKLKWYDIGIDETGSQIEYKAGNAEVLGYDEDDAGEKGSEEFYEWGGEMETHDWGDYESYDQEISYSNFLRMDESVRDNQKLLFDFWKKVGPTLDPDKLKLVGFNMDVYEERVVVWDNLTEYYGDEELTNIIQDRLEGLHDSWSYEYIVTSWSMHEVGDIYLNILVNGDVEIPLTQESGGAIDMSLWGINEKSVEKGFDFASGHYEAVYDEVRNTINEDISEVLLKDLPVDVTLDYLDISEPGSFEDYVKFNKVEMEIIKEDDDGYIDEDLENWSYDGEDIGTIEEQVMMKTGDMLKSDIFKFLTHRFSLIPAESGEIKDNKGNYYRLIDIEAPKDHVTLSHLIEPVVEFVNYGVNSGTFEEGDTQKGIEAITEWLSLAMNQKIDYIN